MAGGPLVELHVHLEACITEAALRRLGRPLPLDRLGATDVDPRWSDLVAFLRAYDELAALFTCAEDYYVITEEYLLAAAADGVLHSELMVSIDHAEAGGTSGPDMIDAVGRAIANVERSTDTTARMIVVAVRHLGAERAREVARLVAELRHPLVTGFGLAGDEAHAAHAFRDAFAIAREAGLGLTAHAGEAAGPESVRAALDLGVQRIGHGFRAHEDAALAAELRDRGILLESCPTSNVALGYCRDYASHPARALADQGVAVSLSSDDPVLFATSVRREHELVRAHWGWSAARIVRSVDDAARAAFLDDDRRDDLLRRLARRRQGPGS